MKFSPVSRRRLAAIAVVCLTLSIVGCGYGNRPSIGSVRGIILFDDKPVAGAKVLFSPTDRPRSRGITDENGRFELFYMTGLSQRRGVTMGAVVGEHSVAVSIPEGDGGESSTKRGLYRREVVVESGRNDFEWDLADEAEGWSTS